MMDLQRLDLGNALYYVELKSNGHRPLFAERAGFSRFLELLAQLKNDTGASPIAYCLLQDCILLVIENGDQSLQNSCNHLVKHYTQYAQQQWNHNGSLFQKHSHSLLLEPSRYLLPLVQQLHQRPVDMGLVAEASIYPWSSLQSYLGETQQPWINTQAFEQFTGLCGRRRQAHQDCLRQPPEQPLDLQHGNHSSVWALASNKFIAAIRKRGEDPRNARPSIDWLLQQTCTSHHLCLDDLSLRQGHRRHLELKAEVIALALEFDQHSPIHGDEIPHLDHEHSADATDILVIAPSLKAELEASLQDSIDTLGAQVITLQQTRRDYLYARYLQLRQLWSLNAQSGPTDATNAPATPTQPLSETSNKDSDDQTEPAISETER